MIYNAAPSCKVNGDVNFAGLETFNISTIWKLNNFFPIFFMISAANNKFDASGSEMVKPPANNLIYLK